MPVPALRFLVIAALLLSLAPIGAGEAGAPHRIQAWYGLGSSFEGEIEGTCQASAVFLSPAGPGRLRFVAGEGSLLIHRAQVNWSRLEPPAGATTIVALGGHVAEASTPIGRATGTISWDDGDSVSVFAAPGPLEYHENTFDATFAASHVTSGPLMGRIHAFDYIVEFLPGQIATFHRDLPLEQRMLTLGAARLEARGGVAVALQGATITFDDGRVIEMPPAFEGGVRAGQPGAAEVFLSRVNYGILTLADATIDVPADLAQVACRSLEATIDGAVHLGMSRGTLVGPTDEVAFEEQELGLVGRFDWVEKPGDRGIEAVGSGTIRSATIDFAMVPGGWNGPSLAEVGLWASLLAALGTAAYILAKGPLGLFSRLNENDLVQHPGRALVLETVRANPNMTLQTLVQTTGLHRSVVRYHARLLEARGLLRSHRVVNDRCFVARETLAREGRELLRPTEALMLRNDPALAEIMRYVPVGGVRLHLVLEHLMGRLGMSKPGAWKAILRAQARGLVNRVKVGREVWIQCA